MPDIIRISGKPKKVLIESLCIRYIPVVVPIYSCDKHATGHLDMSIPNSPHVELMEIFRDFGFDKHKIKETRYIKERRHRCAIGMLRWTEDYIWYHLKKRYKLFKSIKKDYDKHSKIEVLETPFWKSRFGYNEPWLKGPEIWTGAGRASACWVLGITEIPCKWFRDSNPGSGDRGKFGKKLKGVGGIWSSTIDT